MSAPIAWTWDGEVMRPMHRFVAQADRELVVGERYILEPVDEAQSARDRAYHAEIRGLWANLPEEDGERWRDPTDFRRWLLCETGYCDTSKIAFANARAAAEGLPFIQAGGALCGISGAVVVARKAWSQKLRGGMDRETRLKSYRDTVDLALSLIGVSPDDARHGEAA